MFRHSRHFINQLLLIVLIVPLFPSTTPQAQAEPTQTGVTAETEPPPPEPLTVEPLTISELPSLQIDFAITPDPLPVGMTATLTLNVTNQADHPAEDLVVTMPVPDGVRAFASDGISASADEWRWEIGSLAAQTATSVTTTSRCSRRNRTMPWCLPHRQMFAVSISRSSRSVAH